MTRTVPAVISTALASTSFSLPVLVHMKLADGSVITLTDWDEPLSVNLLGEGALSYSPAHIEGLAAFSAQINAPIDDTEMKVILDDATFIADDVRRGAFEGAVVTKGYVLPTSLANPWLYCVYDVGKSDIAGLALRFELMGPEMRLEQPVGRQLTANCPWNYGDTDCGIQTRANAWAATTVYAQHSIVKRLTGTGIYWFKATVGGTSAGSEPAWPATLGGTVVDNDVTWTAIRARRLTGTVTSSANRRTIVATGITVVSDYFGEGFLTFLTGANAGDTRRVKADTGAGALTLQLAAFDDIAAGDTFEVVTGCRHRLTEDCIAKHDNANNSRTRTLRFGGVPFLADENVTATANKG